MRFSTPLQLLQKVLGEEKLQDTGDLPIGVRYPATLNTVHSTGGVGMDSANLMLNGPALKEPLICTDVILRQEITDIRKKFVGLGGPHPLVVQD